MDKEIQDFIIGLGGKVDPVSLAGLTPEQQKMMEPFAVCVRRLTDTNGLRIMFDMDFWLIAQMIRALYKTDGTAKTPEEVLGDML